MNAACPLAGLPDYCAGLPTIPSPTICVLSGTVPDVAGLSRLYRLRLSLADSPTHADRIEFTCLCSSRPCYGLAVLSPLLSTPHHCDAVTVRYRTALHRTETDSHRSIPRLLRRTSADLPSALGARQPLMRTLEPDRRTSCQTHAQSRSQTGAPPTTDAGRLPLHFSRFTLVLRPALDSEFPVAEFPFGKSNLPAKSREICRMKMLVENPESPPPAGAHRRPLRDRKRAVVPGHRPVSQANLPETGRHLHFQGQL